MLQPCPGAIVTPAHRLVAENGGLGWACTLLTVKLVMPVFLMSIVAPALAPTCTVPKSTDVGAYVKVAAAAGSGGSDSVASDATTSAMSARAKWRRRA
jgi:hypothetical protein